jgi:hypothetical protein
MTISVEITGADGSLIGAFDAEAAMAGWAEEIAPLIRDALKLAAPVAPDGTPGRGRLRDSIRYETKASEGGIVITFTAQVPYAGYVVDGTEPHTIAPNAKKALFWPGAAHPVRLVHHPGTRPNDFARRAIEPLLKVIQARLEAAVAEQLTD